MKNFVFLSYLILFTSLTTLGQTGKVYDNLSMKSTLLNGERKYAIYLPPDYETSQRSYPVLYLLHGGGDDQTGWIQFGEVLHIADKAIRDGSATPMIIVMPDASAGQRGFFNKIKGDWNYEDFFFKEFLPYVEKTFRIKNEKRYRAVSGLSSGGNASFIYALHHPELFSSSCPLSAYIGPLSIEEFKIDMERNPDNYSDSVMKNYFEYHNVLSLIDQVSDENLKAVRWFIDCGDDDFGYEGNSLVHIKMRKKGMPHEFRIRDGRHSWTYWRTSLPAALAFISDAFHQY